MMIRSLTGLDAVFLMLETPDMPMHVGSLHYYAVPPRQRKAFAERVRKHLAKRLQLCPVFTRQLAAPPGRLAAPAWIEAPEVDLEYHIRRIELPAPGTHQQLEDCAAALHSRLMDRSRPLWEFYVIEGLSDGRTAFYAKVHHAALDGEAAVALVHAMLDTTPRPRRTAAGRSAPAERPGPAAILGGVLSNQLVQTRLLARRLPALLGAGSRLAGRILSERLRGAMSGEHPVTPLFGPRTRLNVTVGGRRAFAGAQVPLSDAKAIAHALGGTVNDVVLALCSGALRAYLQSHDELPAASLIAAVPVSLRDAGDTSQNTQATMVQVDLATRVDDVLERFATIRDSTASMKSTMTGLRSILPTDFPSLGMPWLVPGLVRLYGRAKIAERLRPPANLVISNVAGPRVPLYLAGARMLTYWPMSIVVHGMALNVTVESYDGTLHFGLVACARALPDVRDLADCLRAAHAELSALAAEAASGD